MNVSSAPELLSQGNILVFIGKFETTASIFIYRKMRPQPERPAAAQKQTATCDGGNKFEEGNKANLDAVV